MNGGAILINAVSVPLRGNRRESGASVEFAQAFTVKFPSPCGVIGVKVLRKLHGVSFVQERLCFRPLAG